MRNTNRKLVLASAITTALGATGTAQALTLGEPGAALLIPSVVADTAAGINTLIGVVTGDEGVIGLDPYNMAGNLDAPYKTLGRWDTDEVCEGDETDDFTITNLHYYFFDAQSVHRGDHAVAATCGDFVRIDWGHLVQTRHVSQDGNPGYMVIGTQWAHIGYESQDGSFYTHLPLWGQAYLISGDWDSQAFIPVIPLADTSTDNCSDNDLYAEIGSAGSDDSCTDVVRPPNGGTPRSVSPLLAGMQLDNDDGDCVPADPFICNSDTLMFSLRYFLDPALSTGTEFIIWLDTNEVCDPADPRWNANSCRSGPAAVEVDIYDADEKPTSAAVDLPNELNIISLNTDGTCNTGCVGSLDGTQHVDDESDEGIDPDNLATGSTTAVNTGFVLFKLKEAHDTGTINGPDRAGVAFSLLRLGAGDNPNQVQTELAHERGVIAD